MRINFHMRGLIATIFAIMISVAPVKASEIDAASPEQLVEILKANVLLTGDIVKRFAAQKRLEQLGKQDPQAVVPLIIKELSPPWSYGKVAVHERLALIELLRDIGPAAEPSAPLLAEILANPQEKNQYVKMQAATALERIGTAGTKSATKEYYTGLQQNFAANASDDEITKQTEQSAYMIRQELRSRQPSDGVISASLDNLMVLSAKSGTALPTLLRAYNDRRLGTALHNAIGTAISKAGVTNIEAAAARQAAEQGVPDILEEIIAETQHSDNFVRSLAMTELSKLGASEPAIEAMIAALQSGQNPGDAVRVLGNYGARAERALPDIARYFDDDRAGANAIQAAGKIGGKIGGKSAAVVKELRRVLATSTHRHRGMAASALGKLGATDALPELQQAVTDGTKYVRILSAKSLGRFGEAALPAADTLAVTLSDPDLELRRAIVVALGQMGAATAVPQIAEQLTTGDTRLKRAARQALEKIGGDAAVAALGKDATRFTNADHAEFNRVASTGGMEDMVKYLFGLQTRRAVPLAHQLLKDPQADNAVAGAILLAREGEIELTLPTLADYIVRNFGTDKMFTGMFYAMAQGSGQNQRILLPEDVLKFIRENSDRYTPEERALFEQRLGGELYSK